MKYTKTAPREERETIISYDALTGKWHLYTNEPKHARKWLSRIKSLDRIEYNETTQKPVVIEGDLTDSNVIISKKRHLTSEQKENYYSQIKKAVKYYPTTKLVSI